jgi:hypothetical protein
VKVPSGIELFHLVALAHRIGVHKILDNAIGTENEEHLAKVMKCFLDALMPGGVYRSEHLLEAW